MRNRAKCKKCQAIIESFTIGDLVECECGAIAITGGTYQYSTFARDYADFLRIDDMGNEIPVKCKDKESDEQQDCTPIDDPKPLSRKELIEKLEAMIKADINLPQDAHIQHLTYVDFLRYIVEILNILKLEG